MEAIHCLGGAGTFSHQAALAYAPDRMPVFSPNLEEVIKSVRRSGAFGIVPLENSTTGLIRPVIDSLLLGDCQIVGDYKLQIDHMLVSLNCMSVDDIEMVYVQREAHDQCKSFLARMKVPVILTDSTALALQSLSDNPVLCAAITTEHCYRGGSYRLLEKNIQNYQVNQTRFVTIARGRAVELTHGVCMLTFELNHTVGALSNLLAPLALLNVNILAIHSRPHPYKLGEYRFYIELNIPNGSDVQEVVGVFEENCVDTKILGCLKK